MLKLFDGIRKSNPTCLQKIIVISGDITADELNLTKLDEKTLITNVNVVFHCAANVKFNDPIKDAVNINTVGTKRVLQLSEKMKNLKVFLYMSTAFCQAHQLELKEEYYPSGLYAEGMIEKIQLMNNECLADLEREL
jgi:alcohol-forming fatty acyl-CoA reductase